MIVSSYLGGSRITAQELHVLPIKKIDVASRPEEATTKPSEDCPGTYIGGAELEPIIMVLEPEIVGASGLHVLEVKELRVKDISLQEYRVVELAIVQRLALRKVVHGNSSGDWRTISNKLPRKHAQVCLA